MEFLHGQYMLQISWNYKAQDSLLAKKLGRAQFGKMARSNQLPAECEMAANRLITLRKYVSGESQTAFAQAVGIEVKRWNNFERGSPLSKEVAILLVRKIPGLTLDWLFLGIEDGLPLKLQRALAELQQGK